MRRLPLLLLPLLLPLLLLPPGAGGARTADEEAMFAAMSRDAARRASANITAIPHVAGTPGGYAVAEMYHAMMEEALAGIGTAEVGYDDHHVLLDTPRHSALTVDGQPVSIREEPVPEDPTSDTEYNNLNWNGYGPSGYVNATGVVYANYGRPEDFATLAALNISVSGKVVLTRYGENFRAVKVFNAQHLGALAVLIYSDPADYGGPAWPNGTYPESPWLPQSGLQRGSVLNLPKCIGNPRGREAKCGASEEELLPGIPVMPISAAAAVPMLQALNATGATPPGWNNAPAPGAGLAPPLVTVNVTNDRNETLIRNVIAEIPGSLPRHLDRPVVLGNHRDAWVFGAVDPNSGSVAMLEVARGLARAWAGGWRPLRTLLLCSWDAEEYGIIGSVAFAEETLPIWDNERRPSVYLNVDSAVSGPRFAAGASASAIDAVRAAAADVADPGTGLPLYNPARGPRGRCTRRSAECGGAADGLGGPGWTRASDWDGAVCPLGGGSDYAPFVNHLGIASVDVGFKFSRGGYPVYHSVYDSFHWMDTQGCFECANGTDAWDYHVAAAQVWGLLAMRFATREVPPFGARTLAEELTRYVDDAVTAAEAAGLDATRFAPQLRGAADSFAATAAVFEPEPGSAADDGGWGAEERGAALALLESRFLSGGLPNRIWYRNVLMASRYDNGYGWDTLPGLSQAIRDGDQAAAEQQAGVVAEAYRGAASSLRHPHSDDDGNNRVALALGLGLGLGIPFLAVVIVAVRRAYLRTAEYEAVAAPVRPRDGRTTEEMKTQDLTAADVAAPAAPAAGEDTALRP